MTRSTLNDGSPLTMAWYTEEFVKLIWMQNFVLGKLITIAQLIAGEGGKVERPDFRSSGEYWQSIQASVP